MKKKMKSNLIEPSKRLQFGDVVSGAKKAAGSGNKYTRTKPEGFPSKKAGESDKDYAKRTGAVYGSNPDAPQGSAQLAVMRMYYPTQFARGPETKADPKVGAKLTGRPGDDKVKEIAKSDKLPDRRKEVSPREKKQNTPQGTGGGRTGKGGSDADSKKAKKQKDLEGFRKDADAYEKKQKAVREMEGAKKEGEKKMNKKKTPIRRTPPPPAKKMDTIKATQLGRAKVDKSLKISKKTTPAPATPTAPKNKRAERIIGRAEKRAGKLQDRRTRKSTRKEGRVEKRAAIKEAKATKKQMIRKAKGKAMMGKMKYSDGGFGMRSVKAGLDNNPAATQMDNAAGKKGKKRGMGGYGKKDIPSPMAQGLAQAKKGRYKRK